MNASTFVAMLHSGRGARRLLATPVVLLALSSASCGPEPLAFRVVHPPDQDPYLGAGRIAVALEESGVVLPETEVELSLDEAELVLPSLPFGTDLALRVETRAAGSSAPAELVLARGRSFRFDYPRSGPAPSAPPDVTLVVLGLFGRSAEGGTESAPRAILPVDGGAVVATDAGRLWRYVAHDVDGNASFVLLANTSIGTGAQWIAIEARGLLAYLADRVELWVEGERVAQLSDARLRAHGDRPAIAPLPDGALIVGGDLAGAPSSAVTRVRIDDTGAIGITPLAPMASGIADARAVAVPVRGNTRATGERVLVYGGRDASGPRGSLLLFDPDASAPLLEASMDPSVPSTGASAAALSAGLVAIVGGATASGVTDSVLLVRVRESAIESVGSLRFGIFPARRDPAIAVIGEGLALIAGGTGALGAPVVEADLLEVPLGPADVFGTGALPAAASAPVAARLGDGSVLVAAEGLLAVYASPRDPP